MRLKAIILFSTVFLSFGLASAQIDSTGNKVVKGILINGNKITKERIVLRELDFEIGDTLDAQDFVDRCLKSQSLLLNTRLFNFATITPVFTENDAVYAKVDLVERWYWWPQVILKFADPNFNTWWETRDFSRINAGVEIYRQNFRGRNEDLRLRVQLGYTRHFALSYRIPYISRAQKMGLRIGAAYREQEEITVGTLDNKRVFYREDGKAGRNEQFLELELTLRPELYGVHGLNLGLVKSTVRDSLAQTYVDYFDNQENSLTYLRLGYQFKADHRDNRGYPLRGDYFQFDIEQRGLGIVNRDGLNLTKLWVQYRYFHEITRKWFYAASIKLNSSPFSKPPYYLQEGLGYSNFIRGYEYYIIDGQHFSLIKSNLKFALVPKRELDLGFGPSKFTRIHYGVYLNAFLDGGYVWDSRYSELNPLSNQFQYSGGLGLDFATYYDSVFRIEFALNRQKETGFFLHFVQPI